MSGLNFDLGKLRESDAPELCPLTEDTEGKPDWAHCCDGYGKARHDGTWNACGAHWRNTEAACHCTSCHVTFVSSAAFDEHHYGPHDGVLLCLTADEMSAWDIVRGESVDGVTLADLYRQPAKAGEA